MSLQPFYELYKTKPRTAQRQVNALVRESIRSVMLDIQSEENYEAIDYIRNTYGVKYAAQRGLDPKYLSKKLDSDMQLCRTLVDHSASEPEKMKELFASALELKSKTYSAGIRDWVLRNNDSALWLILYGITLLCLLPVFLYTLIPNILIMLAPIPLCKKMDKIGGPFVMFKGGVQIVISSLVTAPILYIAVFVLEFIYLGWMTATLHFIMQPWLLIYAWTYYEYARKYLSLIRFKFGTLFARGKERASGLRALRGSLWSKLDELCA